MSTDTWGYAIPGEGHFDSSYSEPAPSRTSLWAEVPTATSEEKIHSTTSTSPHDREGHFDVYYGVNASIDLPEGNYKGTVVYSLVADGTGTPGTGASVSPNKVTAGDTITISTPLMTSMENVGTPSVGVGGLSCYNVSTNIINGYLTISCQIPALSAGNTYDVSVNVSKFGISYAIPRGITYKEPIESITYMQEMTPDICSLTSTPLYSASEVPHNTLIDTRDNKTYTVAKLADGNCWMTQNLRLGSFDEELMLTSDDTDFYIPAQPSARYYLPKATSSTSETWSLDYDNGHVFLDPDDEYGGFYNWRAVTAGSGSGLSPEKDNARSSICPKGWHLPKGNNNAPPNDGDKSGVNSGDFDNLATVYQTAYTAGATAGEKIAIMMKYPINLKWDGIYRKGIEYMDNPHGFYSYMMNGYNVRCIANT